MSTDTDVRDRHATLDDDVLRALYTEHSAPLLSYVQRLTGDHQHAEDVVQETMLRAWRRPDVEAAGRGSLRPWLWTVARHIVIDRARARKARPAEVVELPHLMGALDGDLDASLLALQVVAAVKTLTPAHREVLVETYYRDRSIAEAAIILGVPVGTVKSRTYYALRALKLALEESGTATLDG